MIKRVKATKVGDVFEVKISDTQKKYMQYIASDLTQLNSDVVRGFAKKYKIEEKPTLEEIVFDKVEFYAHCDSRHGIRMEYWTLYGNSPDVGDVNEPIFRSTNDDNRVVISYNWYIWHINGEFMHVRNDDPRLKKAYYGPVFAAKHIYERVIDGYMGGYDPQYEFVDTITLYRVVSGRESEAEPLIMSEIYGHQKTYKSGIVERRVVLPKSYVCKLYLSGDLNITTPMSFMENGVEYHAREFIFSNKVKNKIFSLME